MESAERGIVEIELIRMGEKEIMVHMLSIKFDKLRSLNQILFRILGTMVLNLEAKVMGSLY